MEKRKMNGNYKKRIDALQKYLKEQSVDCFYIDNPIDLFYFTGIKLSSGELLVFKEGTHLFVDGRYFDACKRQSLFPVSNTSEEAKNPFYDFLSKQTAIKTLGFDAENLSYKRYKQLQEILDPLNIKILDQDKITKKIRSVKDSDEIAIMQEAALLGSEGFDYLLSFIKEGISETELAKELELFWLRKGAQKIAFEAIIAFGSASSYPHYKPSEQKLKKGDVILIDIGVVVDHYHSDMTRTVFFGKPNPELEKIYTVVQEAQKHAISYCKPGEHTFKIDQVAREFIAGKGYGKYFSHGLGHGVGLEIHELPVLKNNPIFDTKLVPGMIITIEPGIYLPNCGGVRIEDTILITEDGHENLTQRSTDLLVL